MNINISPSEANKIIPLSKGTHVPFGDPHGGPPPTNDGGPISSMLFIFFYNFY